MYTEAQQINRMLWRPSSVSAQNRKITQEAPSDSRGRSRLSCFYTNTPAKEGRQKSICDFKEGRNSPSEMGVRNKTSKGI